MTDEMVAAAVGWGSLAGMVYFSLTFDSLCPTLFLFLFEYVALLRHQSCLPLPDDGACCLVVQALQ